MRHCSLSIVLHEHRRYVDITDLDAKNIVSAFMERILSTYNTIKVAQQTHTQLLAELKTNAEEVCPESQNLSDVPFLTTRDMVDWDAELGVNKEAKLLMVIKLFAFIFLLFSAKRVTVQAHFFFSLSVIRITLE